MSSQLFHRVGLSGILLAYGKRLQCERSSMSDLHDRPHKTAVLSLYQVGVSSKHAQNEDEKHLNSNHSTKRNIHGQIRAICTQNSGRPVFFFFSHTSTFQLLDKPWSQVSSLLPPGSCLQLLSRIGFSNPTDRRFSSRVANSRSRVFGKSICPREKVPTNIYKYALGGIRTHEADLYQARG